MGKFDEHRKIWNRGQKEFRQVLLSYSELERAVQLFYLQHGRLHSAALSSGVDWSLEDEILDDLNEAVLRRFPQNSPHSIAWTIWHLARIEDIAMNMLVAGTPQVFQSGDWLEKLKIAFIDTGNGRPTKDAITLSEAIDFAALRAYRREVGRRTREIVAALTLEDMRKKVDPGRCQAVLEQGFVLEAGRGVVEYWSRRNVAGLLLMPPTRHNMVHLNEAYRLKGRSQ